MRRLAHSLLYVVLVMTGAGESANGAGVFIANGLARPNPANVIDDLAYLFRHCDRWESECAIPGIVCSPLGDPTAVSLEDGAEVDMGSLHHPPNIIVNGGWLQYLSARAEPP